MPVEATACFAVDGTGAAYVTGSTDSTQATFPVAGGPDLNHNGGADAFVAKVGVTEGDDEDDDEDEDEDDDNDDDT